MAKRKKPVQRAMLIFTDRATGGITVKLDFDPPVENKAPSSPAVAAALHAMQAVMAESKRRDRDE